MSASLKSISLQLWKTKQERKGIQSQFKPLFTRYIGVENSVEYDDILKTLSLKAAESGNARLFDGEISLGDPRVAVYFSDQLNSVDIHSLKVDDVALFENNELLNRMYYDALIYVINLAIRQENFFNENITRNFVKKLIVWSYLYLREKPVDFSNSKNPVCIYYGDIHRHEIYFLMLLHLMTFDVIYINPLRDNEWGCVDTGNLSEVHKNSQLLQIESFAVRSARGKELSYRETATYSLERNLENTLYTNGVYKPWQFRGSLTEPLFLNSTIEDLQVSFAEPAKVREGFNVRGDRVVIPYFFQKIEGVYNDFSKYSALVQSCVNNDYTLFGNKGGRSFLPNSLSRDNVLSLAFCLAGDGTCIPQKVKELSWYPLSRYKVEIQDLILAKINECLLDEHLFVRQFTKEERLEFIALILNLDSKVIKMIDNFDYPNQVPKIVFFLDNESEILDEMMYILGFLSKVGFDIVIFDPSGMFNPEAVLYTDRMNTIRLDKMNYELKYSNISTFITKVEGPKKGFMRKIFG